MCIDFFKNLQNVLSVVSQGVDKIMDPEKIKRFKRFMIHNGNTTWDYQCINRQKDHFFSIIKNCKVEKEIYEYLHIHINLSEPMFENIMAGELIDYFWSITNGIYENDALKDQTEEERKEEKEYIPRVNISLTNTNIEYQEKLLNFLKTDSGYVNIRSLKMHSNDTSLLDIKIAQESVYCKDIIEELVIFPTFEMIGNPKKMARNTIFNTLILRCMQMHLVDLCAFYLVKEAKMLSISCKAFENMPVERTVIEVKNATFSIQDPRLEFTLLYSSKWLKIVCADEIPKKQLEAKAKGLPLSFIEAIFCENVKLTSYQKNEEEKVDLSLGTLTWLSGDPLCSQKRCCSAKTEEEVNKEYLKSESHKGFRNIESSLKKIKLNVYPEDWEMEYKSRNSGEFLKNFNC